jgi:hypothetical protein
MSKNVRLKHQQCERNECWDDAEHLFGNREHQPPQQQRQQRGRHARAEQNCIRVVRINKLRRRKEVFFLREHPRMRRHVQRQAQQRQRGQQFDQRRMFGVISEVGVLPVVVARENVAGFIPALGFAARRERELKRENDQQAGNSRSLQTARWIGRGRSHVNGAVYS